MTKGLVYLTRRVVFCSAHRLHSPKLNARENKKLFDKCNHKYGHGHNYVLHITVKGHPDPNTGLIMNLVELKEIIEKAVLDDFDHKHLNFDVEECFTQNPTVENLVLIIWDRLYPSLKNLLYEVKLEETENNSAYYRGPHYG